MNETRTSVHPISGKGIYSYAKPDLRFAGASDSVKIGMNDKILFIYVKSTLTALI